MVQESKNVLYKFRFKHVILNEVFGVKNPNRLGHFRPMGFFGGPQNDRLEAIICKDDLVENEPCQNLAMSYSNPIQVADFQER